MLSICTHVYTRENPLQYKEMEGASSKTTSQSRQDNPQSRRQYSTQHQEWIWGVQRNTHAHPHIEQKWGRMLKNHETMRTCRVPNPSTEQTFVGVAWIAVQVLYTLDGRDPFLAGQRYLANAKSTLESCHWICLDNPNIQVYMWIILRRPFTRHLLMYLYAKNCKAADRCWIPCIEYFHWEVLSSLLNQVPPRLHWTFQHLQLTGASSSSGSPSTKAVAISWIYVPHLSCSFAGDLADLCKHIVA